MIAPGSKGVQVFFWTAIVVLLASVASKVMAIVEGGAFLALKNTVFPLFSNGIVFLVAAVLEALSLILVAVVRPAPIRAYIILWLSAALALYRFSLGWLDHHQPCGCLGSLGKALGIGDKDVDMAAKVALCYLVLGSLAVLVWAKKSSKNGDKRLPATASPSTV